MQLGLSATAIFLFFLTPLIEVRVLSTLLLCYSLSQHSFFHHKHLSSEWIRLCSILVLGLTFCVFPLWMVTSNPTMQSAYIGALVVIAALWAYAPFSNLPLPSTRTLQRGLSAFGAGLLFLSILNYPMLHHSIPYLGDWYGHMSIGLRVLQHFQHLPTLALLGVSFGWALLFLWKRQRFFLLGMVICLIGIGWIRFQQTPDMRFDWFVRYPLLSYYWNGLLSTPLSMAWDQSSLFDEALFRLPALLCFSALAMLCVLHHKPSSLTDQTLLLLCIVTLPTVFYYATLLYIEPYVLCLMFYVLCRFEQNYAVFLKSSTINGGLLALFLVACLKETNLVFLLSVTGIWGFRLLQEKSLTLQQKIPRLFWLGAFALLPLALYLSFRIPMGARSYQFTPSSLFEIQQYQVFAQSLWDQFGIIGMMGLVGSMLLLRKSPWLGLLNLGLIVGYLAFFMADGNPIHQNGWTANPYMGHSRFNLYFLPSLLLGHLHLLTHSSKWTFKAVAILILLSNIHLIPFNIIGSEVHRKVGWGDYVRLTSEIDYPYHEFYQWMATQPAQQRILFIHEGIDYLHQFYLHKYELNEHQHEYVRIQTLKSQPLLELSKYDWVVIHQMYNVNEEDLEHLQHLKKQLAVFPKKTFGRQLKLEMFEL